MSSQHPNKLRELQDMFWVEAEKYNVLLLDGRFIERADPSLRPSLIEGCTFFTYYPGATRIPESSAVNTKNKTHTIIATIDMPKQGGDGVIVAAGGIVAGYTLYVRDRKPIYEYNWFSHATLCSAQAYEVCAELLALGRSGSKRRPWPNSNWEFTKVVWTFAPMRQG